MTLATLNVVIDPTKASSGAAAAVQAAKAVEAALKSAGAEAKKLGGAFEAMQQQTQRSGGAMRSAFSGMVGMLSNVSKGVLGIGAAFGALYAAMLPIMALVKGLTAGFSLLMGAINGAADFEDYTIQFAGLLGSFQKADSKLAELSDIAAKTPFNLPEIVKGTITLQTLSDGALVARDKLTMIGDAAAKAKQPFDVMAESIGRVFIAAKTGGELIEQLKTLTAQGVIGAEAFVKIKALGGTEANEGGKNFLAIWKAVTGELQKAKGQMELMSQSTNGLFSTLQDAWAGMQRILGAALNQGVRPIVRSITEEIDSWSEKLKEFAPDIEAAAVKVAALINVMRGDGGMKLVWNAGIETMQARLERIMTASGMVLRSWMEVAAYRLETLLSRMTTANFWQGMADSLHNAALDFLAVILKGIDSMIARMKEVGGALAGGAEMLMKLNPVTMIPAFIAGSMPSAPGEAPAPENPLAQYYRKQSEFVGPPLPPPAALSFSDAYKATPEASSSAANSLAKRIAEEAKKITAQNATSRDNLLLPPIDAGPKTDLAGAAGITADAKATKKAADEMQKSAQRYIEATRTPAEQLEITLKEITTLENAGKLSSEDAGRARVQAQEDYQKSLKKSEQDLARLGKLENSHFQQLMNSWSNLAQMTDQASVSIAHSMANNIAGGLTDIITGTKSASEAFSQMASAIVQDIIRIIIQMLVMRAISSIFGGAGGAAAQYHTGGVVGTAPETRSVSASTFANAPRFQHGGVIPSGERGVITEPGETVLTRAQSSDIKERMGKDNRTESDSKAITIVNVTDPGLIEQAIAKNPRIILNVIGTNKMTVKRMLA